MQSENIGELAAALAKAQSAMPNASKDATNPHFKSRYADLASIWDACRKPLTDNGLAVIQAPVSVEAGYVGLTTTLLHASGQWIAETVSAPLTQNTAQSVGSALTYLRRYALAAMVGVAPDDDDGNTASQPAQAQPYPRTSYTAPTNVTTSVNTSTGEIVDPSVLSDKQYGLIKGLIKKGEWQETDWIEWAKAAGYPIETLRDLSKRAATEMIDALKAELDKPVEAAPFERW
jgi:hypothetical protein